MQKTDKVTVIGAGPVGFLTALGLARGGIPVAILDAAPGINNSPRAAVYFPTTIEILDRLGLLEDTLAAGYQSTRFSYRLLATGESVHISHSFPADSPYPYNVHLGQHLLAELVQQHLCQLHGVDVQWDTRLTGLSQDETGVTLTVQTAEGSHELRSDWVVGADGARSSVRHLLGLSFEGHTWPERLVATNVEYDFERYGFESANMIADPVHWGVVARLGRDNLWRVTYAEDASLPEEQTAQRIPEHYAAILPDPEAPYRVIASSPYRVHERCVPSFRVGRVLLAGDAAHVCNPCGGMGLTGGVIDAKALVEVMTAVIRRKAPESVLDFYATERRRVFLEVSSPAATRYKGRMSQPDLQLQRQDFEEFRLQADTPEQVAMSTTMAALVLGHPMPV
jgi:2-polyprenyl-6-methoxyphenol hydroxylase-like FAD-dependent oxidoreductase